MEERVRLRRDRRADGALAALLDANVGAGSGEAAYARVLVARSVADDPRIWRGVGGRIVDDASLAQSVREQGERVDVVAIRDLDDKLFAVLRDRLPPLLVIAGTPDPGLVAELERLAARLGAAILGPGAVLRLGPERDDDANLDHHALALIACAGHRDELERLCTSLGPTRLAIAPTPAWLPRWLIGPRLLRHDVVGYVPAAALRAGWSDWLDWVESVGPRELDQLLVPLGVPKIELEPYADDLETAAAAHALERVTGPTFPAPRVLALLREAWQRRHHEAGHEPGREPGREPGHEPVATAHDDAALALWDQARRALPRIGEQLGMRAPDPALALRVPTAAFLAQRSLLRLRTSAALLDLDFEAPELPDPELLDRADAVLEGAAETLSDQESKVVLRGHGIEVTRQAFANSASGAVSFADKIGYPVALKALSPELRRKRELGAIELDVHNGAAVKRAYANIVANVEERAPTVALDGVVIAEMIEPGLDLRCGGLRTRAGGVVVFAQAMVDAHVEATLAPSPLSPLDALLLAEAALTAVPLPARRRASDPDVGVLASLLLQVDGLFRHTGERLLAVDLSPVRLVDSERRYVTLDARIVQRPHVEGR